MRVTKEMSATATLSTLAALLVSITTLWTFTERVFAGEIKEQLRPLTDAFELTTTMSIRNLRASISAMTFKRDMCRDTGCWTVTDQQLLDQAVADLATAEAVLKGLKENR